MIARTDNPEMGVVTGAQTVSYVFTDGILHRDTTKLGTLKDLRALWKDPTITLGSGLLVSGILAGSWSIETDEEGKEEVVDFITKVMLPLREQFIQAAVTWGRIAFGWQGFEKVFAIKEGRIAIERLKPLLHDITLILVDASGEFRGFKQNLISAGQLGLVGSGTPVVVPLEKCLLVNFDVEAGNLYGYPLLENIVETQDAWDECNKGAKKYDEKIAGAHWQLHYPIGTTVINDEPKDNYEIALEMIAALEASGSIVVPSTVAEEIQELNQEHLVKLYQWNVELICDTSPRQPSFVDRLKYLDGLKLRGLHVPERACTEGKYGTRAESETHVDLLITTMEQIDRHITQIMNSQCIDQLLALNWGLAPGTVRLVAAPLIDEQIAFLRKLYLATSGKQIDVGALQEKLNIPLGKEKNEPEPTHSETND